MLKENNFGKGASAPRNYEKYVIVLSFNLFIHFQLNAEMLFFAEMNQFFKIIHLSLEITMFQIFWYFEAKKEIENIIKLHGDGANVWF